MNAKKIIVKWIVFFIVSTPRYLRASKILGENEKVTSKMETRDYEKSDYNTNLLTFYPQNRKLGAYQRHPFEKINYERIPGKVYETNEFSVFSSGTEETPMYYDSANNGYFTTNRYSKLGIESYPIKGESNAYDYNKQKEALNFNELENFGRLSGHYISEYGNNYGHVGDGSYGYHSVGGMLSHSVFCRISWILRRAFTNIRNKISLPLKRALGKVNGLKIFFAVLTPLVIVLLLAPFSFGQLFLPVALVITNVQGKRKRQIDAEYKTRSDYNQFLIQHFQQKIKSNHQEKFTQKKL
ncbi:uncharacterized protein LOC143254601 [Tachypleus tridentatus]|uniref:uncharacterized protein LOC143254601 n=1 Tax=Tachypleus tridentatus TaxID=6853 RepID=UPI003FD36D29